MITLDSLTKTFQTENGLVTAVDRVSLEVPEGEICILLGPSGCGKTTTLKMVNRIIPPSAGRVLIHGEDTTALNTVDLRRRIGYVIQQIGLFPNMTIGDNITVVPKLLGWESKRYNDRASELLELVGMDPGTFLRRYPNELSGGQQQRVGVIRALAADPPVMLMDEPFGAIDPINRAVIQDEFLRMQGELRKTILFVSHDIDEAVKMGDRIAIFRDGKLVQYDTPDDLLAHPKGDFVESFLGDDRALKRLQLVQVSDVMDSELSTVGRRDTLEHALSVIESRGYYRGILVVDDKQRPVGMVMRDTARSMSGQCADHSMSLDAVAHVDDDLRKVASLMFAHDTTWLPCIDDDGRVCGQVTQRGITHHLGDAYRPQGA